MWMCSSRATSCASISKASNEIRLIGVLGQDDLDRHFPTDGGLIGLENRSKPTHTDELGELISLDGCADQVFHLVNPHENSVLRSRQAQGNLDRRTAEQYSK